MQLNFKSFGNGPALVILHGLFGSLDNWVTLGKRFGADFSVYILDSRNHGKSPHTDDINYPLMAEDLLGFLESQAIPTTHLLGHSMGGKTAMRFCLDHSERVEKLIVADMPPVEMPESHVEIFDALLSLPLADLSSRQEAESLLTEKIPNIPTRQFILKSIERDSENRFEWKFNLSAIHKQYSDILKAVDSSQSVETPSLFIRGGKSDYVKDENFPSILKLFPNAKIETIQNAGHWVHAEAPEEFYNSCMRFLKD